MADEPLWDGHLARQATVIKRMETLGAVKLTPRQTRAGFKAEEKPTQEEEHDEAA